MNEHIKEVAEEMPDHQTSRGDEFRNESIRDRFKMARQLMLARQQATAGNADWESYAYRREMRHKKQQYFYAAGELGVDMDEASKIWWSYVHDDPSPYERRDLI